MKHINILLLSLMTAAMISSCTKTETDFSGQDNFIASFELTKDGVTLNAAISPGTIVISAPESFSLDGAVPKVVMSENAIISPDPASIMDWSKEQIFTVTSYNGTKTTYQYSVKRTVISKEGDIVLLTQADVDALAALKLTQINGSLTIGAATGKDSVFSLTGLSTLRSIQYGLYINATYSGADLDGLSNLEKVGALQVLQNKKLRTIALPKLTSVVSDLIVNQSLIQSLDFPELTNVDKGLQVINTDSLLEMNYPKLKNIVENLTLQASFGANKLPFIQFPLLEKVGGNINVTNWKEVAVLEFPQLMDATAFTVNSMPKLTILDAPKLRSTAGICSISSNSLMSTMDLGDLANVGGDLRLENNALTNLDGLNSLATISGECYITNMTKLKSIEGLKALKSVGKRLYISGLTALEDETLNGLSGLGSVGGELTISQVPFKKFTGFALTQVSNLGIYGNGLSSIEEIDVTNLNITNTLLVSNISTPFTLKGKNVFSGNLTFEYANLDKLEGFSEVNNLNYSMNLNTQAERTLNVQKVNGNLTLSVYNFSKFSMPLLTEVKGTFNLTTSAGIQSLELPLLKKTGAATLDLAIFPAFSLPALELVDGDLSISSGKYQADNLADLQMPALTTINGVLKVAGYSSYYYNSKLKNLNGLTALRNVKGVNITYNLGLVDYTGLKDVLPSFTAANWSTTNNAYNPSYQDMLDGKYVKP